MTIRQLSTESVSSTGAQFLVDSLSATAGANSIIPYSKIMDGRAGGTAVAAVTTVGLKTDPGPVAISGTAMVQVMNQLDASVHGVVTIGAGTASIGKVDISATANVVVLNQIDASVHGQVTIGAGTASIGKVDISATASVVIGNTPNVIASNETGTIYNGSTALTPKFANISMNTAASQIIVAAVAAKKIRVINLSLVAKGAVNLYFADGGGNNNLMGDSTNKVGLGANGGFVLPYSPVGWFQTSASSAFTIVPDTATAIAGTVVYVEV